MRRHAFGVCLLLSGLTWAHGVAPQITHISRSPDAQVTLLGSTFGALVQLTPQGPWALACEEAVGLSTADRPVWLAADAQTFFAAALTGLYVSRNAGCDWAPDPKFSSSGAADLLRVGPQLWLTTARFSATNGVWSSADLGVTWQPAPLSSNQLFFSAIRSAPSRPQRLYVSAWFSQPSAQQVFVSDDQGLTFTTIDLRGTLPATGAFTLLTVDPASPDTLYATVSDTEVNQTSWLLRSVDRGATFTALLSKPGLITQATVVDGWLSVAANGQLLRAPTSGGAFTTLSAPAEQACAQRLDDLTLTCGNGVPPGDGFAIASVSPTNQVTPWFTYQQLTGPLRCSDASKVSTRCAPVWATQRVQLGLAAQPSVTAVDNQLGPAARGCQSVSGPWAWASAFVGLRLRRRRLREPH